MKHNIWILAIENNTPITAAQAIKDLQSLQHSDKQSDPIKMVIAKRSSKATKTQIEQDWATFDQMRIVPYHIIDSDTLPHPSIPPTPITTSPTPPVLPSSPNTTSPVSQTSVGTEGTTELDQMPTSTQQQQDNQQTPPRRSSRQRKPAEWYTDPEQ